MTTLKPGDKAPDFKSTNQNGDAVSLSTYLNTDWLVLYFYPHDMTPTCTVQANNLNDNLGELTKAGITVVGVSEDGEAKHCKFIDKHSLKFDLLADEDHSVHKAYEVWGPKKFMGKVFDGTHRTTFLIDKSGIIQHVIFPVKAKIHTEQIMSLINKTVES